MRSTILIFLGLFFFFRFLQITWKLHLSIYFFLSVYIYSPHLYVGHNCGFHYYLSVTLLCAFPWHITVYCRCIWTIVEREVLVPYPSIYRTVDLKWLLPICTNSQNKMQITAVKNCDGLMCFVLVHSILSNLHLVKVNRESVNSRVYLWAGP